MCEEPLPNEMKESFRRDLKIRRNAVRLFSDARKIAQKGITDAKKIRNKSHPSSEELFYAITTYLMSVERLKRIDDFEMIHLNMIDLQEQISNCCKGGETGQKTREVLEEKEDDNHTKTKNENYSRYFGNYNLEEIKLNLGIISTKWKKSIN